MPNAKHQANSLLYMVCGRDIALRCPRPCSSGRNTLAKTRVSYDSFRRLAVRCCFFVCFWLSVICFAPSFAMAATAGSAAFQQGAQAYADGKFEQSASLFGEAARAMPSPGTLHNLGDAEWQCGHVGPAVLAWERAHWLNPLDRNTRTNLRFGRKAAQLDAPDLAWYEVCSAWLPAGWWDWIACLSFWLALGLVTLPGALRWRKADWHQAVAAAGFAIFLLTLPALVGVETRSKLGIVLQKDTPLRLTPTNDAQVIAKLPAGETARFERKRGHYLFIRTVITAGWVEQGELGLIAGPLQE